jgi:hypothetical protein
MMLHAGYKNSDKMVDDELGRWSCVKALSNFCIRVRTRNCGMR